MSGKGRCNSDQYTSKSGTVKLSVNPAGAFYKDGLVAGVNISFMLDTLGHQFACCNLLYVSSDLQWNGS